MRLALRSSLLLFLLPAAAACRSTTAPAATLALTTSPDFSGTVARVQSESGVGPGGAYSQYDVWVTVPPATSASAGVVVPRSVPVFVRAGGTVTAARASDIRVGDAVAVWDDGTAAYGAVQGPPGAPTYTATQVVISR